MEQRDNIMKAIRKNLEKQGYTNVREVAPPFAQMIIFFRSEDE